MSLSSRTCDLGAGVTEECPSHVPHSSRCSDAVGGLPFVSVVIPTLNRCETLKVTLNALFAQDYPVSRFEIIVVDDCSSDSTGAEVNGLVSRAVVPIRYYRNSVQLGTGGSRNVGIGEARGEIIALTDSDTIPVSNWISSGVSPFLGCESIAGVEGSVFPPEEASVSPFSDILNNRRGGRYTGCNMFYRKAAIVQAGGYDERLFDKESGACFREDLDMAIAVMKNGGVIQFQPEAAVCHPPHRPYLCRPIDLMKRYIHDPLLMKKHTGTWRRSIDPLRLGPVRTSMPRHKLYALYLSFAALTAVALFISSISLLFLGMCGEVLTAFGVLFLHWRICRKASAASLVFSAPVILLCPYVFAYWFIRGWFRARRLLRSI